MMFGVPMIVVEQLSFKYNVNPILNESLESEKSIGKLSERSPGLRINFEEGNVPYQHRSQQVCQLRLAVLMRDSGGIPEHMKMSNKNIPQKYRIFN